MSWIREPKGPRVESFCYVVAREATFVRTRTEHVTPFFTGLVVAVVANELKPSFSPEDSSPLLFFSVSLLSTLNLTTTHRPYTPLVH